MKTKRKRICNPRGIPELSKVRLKRGGIGVIKLMLSKIKATPAIRLIGLDLR
jgi:hypothetical protein